MDDTIFTTLDGSTTKINAASLNAFREQLRGVSITRGDGSYDDERKIWNASTDKYPEIIVKCTGASDVMAAVNFARENYISLAVRGGGHNVAGNSVCDGGVVIDLSAMNNVRVLEKTRRAHVGGGALLGDMDRETQVFGLAAPLGVVSLTGVAGLTLCGGLGYLRRKHGMACDALISIDIVTADGKLLHASKSENVDLFWGCRGGGGNFGVVISFEFELYPVGPTVNLCAPFYPVTDSITSIVHSWRDFMSGAPEDISSNLLFWSIPDHPNFPEELRGIPVVIPAVVHIGNAEDAGDLLQPLRELGEPLLDLSGPIPYVDLQTSFDPLFLKADRQNYWKSIYLDTLNDKAIEKIIARAKNRPDPWSLVALWHLGGQMNRVNSDETALGVRNANYLLSFDTSWVDPAINDTAIAWTREAWNEMKPFSDGGSYLNFPGLGEEGEALLKASYGDENYARLVSIKKKYDPQNLFRLNQNIEPNYD